jgi:hypothetical protein
MRLVDPMRQPERTTSQLAKVPGVLAMLCAASVTTGACGANDLDYVQDDRVTITAPSTNDTVTLPFEVSWTVDDFDGTFAVFFDRSPMPRGRDLRSLVPRDDGVCRADPACPDADWLAARGIYVTDETHLTISALPDRRQTTRQKDRHEAIIVLLDENGERVRESAFIREFMVDRD